MMIFFIEQVEAVMKNVKERNLVTEAVKSKDITKEHAAYCEAEREIKHFQGENLAYVTPVRLIMIHMAHHYCINPQCGKLNN